MPRAAALWVLAAAVCLSCVSRPTPPSKKAPVTLLKFTRTGGLAGSRIAGTVQFSANHAYVDSEGTPYRRELAPQELKQLRADAEAADFPAQSPVPSGYQFEVTVVTEDGASHSFSFGDNVADRFKQMSPAASRLASWVEREAGNIAGRRI